MTERRWPPRVGLGVAVLGLVAVALVLRLWELGERPFHHDESLDAWWSWLFRNGRFERYDPVYHGPLRFYVTAGLFEIFGESEAVARLLSALTGTAVVGLPWFLRHELGRAGTLAAAAALCISPTMLYYSRFGREDAQMVFLTLLALVLGLAFLRRPRTVTAAGLAFVLACSFAIKESTYLFGLLLAVYLLVVLAAQFEAQTRPASGARATAADRMSPAFFGSALTFAGGGLLVAVVVGERADELFPSLALFMAGLSLFVLATAMPRLRAAGIGWAPARAALTVVGLAVTAQLVRVWRTEATGEWEMSPVLAAGLVVTAVLIAAVAALPSLRARPDATIWLLAAIVAGGGLVAYAMVQRDLQSRLADVVPASGAEAVAWEPSVLALVIGALALIAGLLAGFGPDLGATEPVDGPDNNETDSYGDAAAQARPALPDGERPAWLGPLGAGLAAFGAALILNEYTESHDDRVVVGVFLAVLIAAGMAVARSLPSTRAGFEWPPMLRAIGAIGWRGWIVTVVVFAASWWLFFTVWGTVKEDWASGFTRAIDYWDSQQEVNRGGQPWYYYLYALPAYEWFFVALAVVGSWRCLRRPTIASGLFVWFAFGSLVLYSYAGERMPWLIAHPLLPMLVLAGYGVAVLWDHRDHPAMAAIAAACAIALALTIGTSLRASFPNGTDSRELLSQAGQATPHVTAAIERLDNIDAMSMRATGEPALLAIGTANAWPWNWYLRNRTSLVWFDNETGPPDDPGIDVIIGDHSAIDPADFPDFQATAFAMRSWWVPTYTEAGPLRWLRWARDRSLWPQHPNPNYAGVTEAVESPVDTGLSATLERLRNGADRAAEDFVGFIGANDDQVAPSRPTDDTADDGRDGCGSVDQWFLVHIDFAFAEQQVYPEPIEAMGPLACASDLLATS